MSVHLCRIDGCSMMIQLSKNFWIGIKLLRHASMVSLNQLSYSIRKLIPKLLITNSAPHRTKWISVPWSCQSQNETLNSRHRRLKTMKMAALQLRSLVRKRCLSFTVDKEHSLKHLQGNLKKINLQLAPKLKQRPWKLRIYRIQASSKYQLRKKLSCRRSSLMIV